MLKKQIHIDPEKEKDLPANWNQLYFQVISFPQNEDLNWRSDQERFYIFRDLIFESSVKTFEGTSYPA